MKHIVQSCCILPVLLCAAGTVQAEGTWGDNLSRMVTEGKASLDFRFRHENVDQANISREAKASTMRSRLTLASAPWGGFSALLEIDDLTSIGTEKYNSTENGNSEYPVVADPTGTDVNQVYLKYDREGFDGTLGRQRILHGNQRFVGGVGWRQNEQTYDGFRANITEVENLQLDFSYVKNVSRIFGPDDGANPADLNGDNYLMRADYQIAASHKITGFGYLLDFESDHDYDAGKTVNNSSETYGVEYSGTFDKLSLNAAYATQSEADDSELDYDADYYMIEAGAKLDMLGLKVGYEVLGAGDGVGFKTPLATLHKFQGWADKFLGTPGDGIEDLYLGANGQAGPVKLGVVYHDFQAEDSSEDFGTELDLVATWPVNKHFTTQLKYASFESDSDRYTDTDKLWLTLQLKL